MAKKEIARLLGRDIKTIRRELTRDNTRVSVGSNDWRMVYEPIHANSVAQDRKKNAWFAKQPLKNKNIYFYVMEHLRGGWSPEQISGRLREENHKEEKDWQIRMETIYQSIYKKKLIKQNRG